MWFVHTTGNGKYVYKFQFPFWFPLLALIFRLPFLRFLPIFFYYQRPTMFGMKLWNFWFATHFAISVSLSLAIYYYTTDPVPFTQKIGLQTYSNLLIPSCPMSLFACYPTLTRIILFLPHINALPFCLHLVWILQQRKCFHFFRLSVSR